MIGQTVDELTGLYLSPYLVRVPKLFSCCHLEPRGLSACPWLCSDDGGSERVYCLLLLGSLWRIVNDGVRQRHEPIRPSCRYRPALCLPHNNSLNYIRCSRRGLTSRSHHVGGQSFDMRLNLSRELVGRSGLAEREFDQRLSPNTKPQRHFWAGV